MIYGNPHITGEYFIPNKFPKQPRGGIPTNEVTTSAVSAWRSEIQRLQRLQCQKIVGLFTFRRFMLCFFGCFCPYFFTLCNSYVFISYQSFFMAKITHVVTERLKTTASQPNKSSSATAASWLLLAGGSTSAEKNPSDFRCWASLGMGG